MTISPYYFRFSRYDPFTGGKRLAGRLAKAFADPDDERQWAEESAREWHGAFTYERLRLSLDVNRLLVPRLGVQIDVHYGFLSAYVHGAQQGYDLVYGRNRPIGVGSYDHYADELCTLYVISLAAAELEVFGRMAKRRPRLELLDWPAVERTVAEARAASEYFWFLSGVPHEYDRIQEVHARLGRLTRTWKSPRVKPVDLQPARVHYYPNPLRRVTALHDSWRELTTGLTFVSPFLRPDARFRL